MSALLISVQSQNNFKHVERGANGKEIISLQVETTQVAQINNFYKNKSVVWSESVNVSSNENEDSRDMGVAMGPDSTLHVVYCDDVPGFPSISSQRIVYRNKPVNGEWSDAIIVDAFDGVTPRNNHRASINVSDNGDVHVIFHYWAYDGTMRDQVGYSKYTKESEIWSTEIISGDVGTISSIYSDYPKITSTETNIPVVAWGNDNRSGSEEVYITYNNGTWAEPMLVSSPEINKGQFAVVTPIGNEKVFVLFREYNNDGDSLTVYYRIFDASTGDLSNITKIPETKRLSTTNYDVFDLYDACNVNNEKVFIADNSQDTIYSYYYDINDETVTKNLEVHRSNYSGPTNYNMLSVCSDSDGLIHLGYSIWNTDINTVRYLNYHEENGFSESVVISNTNAFDAPRIIFGKDKQLHVIYADDSEDTNYDGYIDREVYYSTADCGVGVENVNKKEHKIIAYPNPSQNGIFQLKTDEYFEIEINNMSGILILKTNSRSSIDLSAYPNGIYLLSAKSNIKNYHTILVKE